MGFRFRGFVTPSDNRAEEFPSSSDRGRTFCFQLVVPPCAKTLLRLPFSCIKMGHHAVHKGLGSVREKERGGLLYGFNE